LTSPVTIWLALDFGERRIGVAAGSDETRLARPLAVLSRRSRREDFAAIARLAAEVGAERILIGLPYRMDGSEGPQAARVRRFARDLEHRLGLPVLLWDERLSTLEAEQIAAEIGRRRRHHDDLAAALILEAYFAHSNQ
jgi:putative Holliday junction resolvase